MGDTILTTMVMLWDRQSDSILMINRRKEWKGYAPPGGHVESGESITEAAIREVREETGLEVSDLQFKGFAHFEHEEIQEKYLVFNYITNSFRGTLIEDGVEGRPEWIPRSRLHQIQMAPGLEERISYFFDETPSEIFILWNEKGKEEKKIHQGRSIMSSGIA